MGLLRVGGLEMGRKGGRLQDRGKTGGVLHVSWGFYCKFGCGEMSYFFNVHVRHIFELTKTRCKEWGAIVPGWRLGLFLSHFKWHGLHCRGNLRAGLNWDYRFRFCLQSCWGQLSHFDFVCGFGLTNIRTIVPQES